MIGEGLKFILKLLFIANKKALNKTNTKMNNYDFVAFRKTEIRYSKNEKILKFLITLRSR